MVYYINNFKSLNGLIEKRNEIVINIFKLTTPINVITKKEFINNEWKLTITVTHE
jgi:hypothetical protein